MTSLSEQDICTQRITPALVDAGWDLNLQVRQEVSVTKGRIIVRGKLVSRGRGKRADYILYIKPNIPLAVIEAKDASHAMGDGIQQALDYAETLGTPSPSPPTARASSSTTGPSPKGHGKPRSRPMPSRAPPNSGTATVSGKA